MKTILPLIIIFLLGLFSCSMNSSENKDNIKELSVDPEANALPEPQFITDINKKEIISVTDTLYKGDTLKIKFKTPHSKDFAITTPNDKFFFVIFLANDTTKPSLVDWQEFADLDHLEIITNKTKANPWDARINENQIIFTKTGKYEIKLSENLETDDGTPVEVEEVYYIDELKR